MQFQNTLFLASANPHKIEELEQILKPFGIELKTTRDFPGREDVEEDQPTLEGNALKKARFWNRKTGLSSLADDTGLEVNALNGAPGVRSARYAGERVTYRQNVEKLLKEMEGEINREAQFRTVIAFVDGEVEKFFEGICMGQIIQEPRGNKGFGYDPIFVPKGFDKTFAELSPKEKNLISHRGLALQEFIKYLR